MSKDNTSNEIILNAMDVYLTEWIHRDKHLWSQSYKFFFAALVVMFLPELTEKLGFSIPEALNKQYIFPIIGLFLSLAFFYVSIGNAKRLKSVGHTYSKLINQLPSCLQRTRIDELKEFKIVNHVMVYVMPCAMFVSLIAIAVILLFVK